MHKHRAIKELVTAENGSVNPHKENKKAHGGITVVQTCKCGSVRKIAKNGCEQERGEWSKEND